MLKISHVKDYGTRRLLYIVDDSVPESYHIVAGAKKPHSGTAPPSTDPTLKPFEWCKACHHDNPIEFQWDKEAIKPWDMLYEEVALKLGVTVDAAFLGSAPREAPQLPPEFAAFPLGEPTIVDGVVSRKYRIKHNEEPTSYNFEAFGTTPAEFKESYDKLFLAAQEKINSDAAALARAKAIAI